MIKFKSLKFSIILGNVLEWYEFSLYAYMASIFAKVFFPEDKGVMALLIVFASYAISFSMRPFGGLVMGYIGDCYGRKLVLLISVITLTLLTLGIGLLPSYASIGILSPIFLIVLRLLQGAFVSVEYVGATVYQSENNPTLPGFFASFIQLGAFLGAMLASLIVVILTLLFSPELIQHGLWRIPYLLAGIFAIGVLWYRWKLPAENKQKQERESLIVIWKNLCKNNKLTLLRAFFIPAAATSATYYFIYQLNSLISLLKMNMTISFLILITSKLVLFISLPCFAYFGDRVGRSRFLVGSLVLLIVFSYPLFYLMNQFNFTEVFIGQVLFALLAAPYLSLNMVYVTLLFRRKNRLTSSTCLINLSIATFGATTPFISLLLVKITGILVMPVVYFLFTCLLSLLAMLPSILSR